MAGKGPTRAALQSQCVVAPVSGAQNLRGYFQAARSLVLQGETYYAEGNLVHVSLQVVCWVMAGDLNRFDVFFCMYYIKPHPSTSNLR